MRLRSPLNVTTSCGLLLVVARTQAVEACMDVEEQEYCPNAQGHEWSR